MKQQGLGVRTPLIRIHRPISELKRVAVTRAFYNPEREVTIYELPTGGFVSCELSNGWLEYWYEGDYRKITQNWPLSQSQYYEF